MKAEQNLDAVLSQPVPWLDAGPGHEIVISTRVRLARNLAGHAFPGRATDASAAAVLEAVLAGSEAIACPAGLQLPMADLAPVDRQALFERRITSREQDEGHASSGVVVGAAESYSIMINEEDHVRLQVLRPGLQLSAAWREASRLDDLLGKRLRYAFSGGYGFLTACPSNVGTGLRASVMLHLPGLMLTGQVTGALRAVGILGLAVRGVFGEGSDAIGDLYQVSNQATLGDSEEEIVSRLLRLVTQLQAHEKNARAVLRAKHPNILLDYVGQAYGRLRHAYLLSGREALQYASGLRLGVLLGMFSRLDMDTVHDLWITLQPGHLQRLVGTLADPRERDATRARLVRARLAAHSSAGSA